MTHDLHDLLDGVADAALGARRLDAWALLEQGRLRRRRSLRRRASAGFAVAAAILLGLVLVPLRVSSPPEPARPPSGPVGMPRSLPLPTPWTPTIAESPIGQASLLVSVFAPGSDWAEDRATLAVSADGTAYRLLQASPEKVRLTDDGRRLVYYLAPEGARPHATLHVVDLSDGRDHAVPLPDGGLFSTVQHIVLAPDSRTVYVRGTDGTQGTADGENSGRDVTWKVDVLTGDVTRVAARPVHITGDGTMYASEDAVAGGLRALPQLIRYESEEHLVSSPDGQGFAALAPGPYLEQQQTGPPAFLVVRDGKPTRVDVGVPARHAADLVAWGAGGLLYTWDDGLRSVEPATREVKVVTTLEHPTAGLGQEGRFSVSEVAGWAARSVIAVPGVTEQPEPSLAVRVLMQPRGGVRPVNQVLLALAALGAIVLAWSRRKAALPPR